MGGAGAVEGEGEGDGAGVVVDPQTTFPKGSLVEVGSDEEGFKGAWYVATVIEPPPPTTPPSKKKKNTSTKKNPNTNKLFVEYHTLLDDDGSTLLRERVKLDLVRPLPPPISETDELAHSFELYDVVDAFYRDGWWTGVITRVFDGPRFVVTFQNPPDEIQFGLSDLRVHREWVNGKWVRSEKQRTTGLMFSSGKRVEVSFDKEECLDVWFPATVLEDLGNNSFLVAYQISGNGDEAVLLEATVDLLHIRPCPPHLKDKNFDLLEKLTNKQMELSQSELRPHMEWIDGKWIAASQEVLIPSDYQEHAGHASIAANNTQMAVQLGSPDASKDHSAERTLYSLNSGEYQTEQTTPSNGKPSGVVSQRKKTKQKNPDSDASHSRPSKKLKEGNTLETPSLTRCQLNTTPKQTPSKDVGAGTNCSKQSMDSDWPSAKTQSRSRRKQVQNKQLKVGELDDHAKGVVKRKGSQPKFQVKSPLPSAGGVNAAEEFDEKDCTTKEVDSSVIMGLPCNAVRSPQTKKPRQLPSEESLKSISDQKDQLKDPESHNVKEISQLIGGEGHPKKRRGRPPKLLGESPDASVADKKQNSDVADELVVKDSTTNEVELPSTAGMGCKKLLNGPTWRKNMLSSMTKNCPAKKDKLPNEKVVQAPSKQLEKPSLKRGRRRIAKVNIESPIQDGMMKESGMAVDEVPNNVSDDQPLSTWFGGVSPNVTFQHCTETSEKQIEIAMQAAAVKGNGDIVLDPSCLPFVKTSPLWKMIESMEVFQVMPQKPHFHPLDSCKEGSREGLAIGCMVTFSTVVKKTSELQFDDPRSSIEDSLETLLDLEGHGFDVKVVRDRLTGLLLIKDRQELLQDQSKEVESRIMDHSHEKTRIDEEIEEINKQIRELEEKRALAMSMKETKDSEIDSLQSSVETINEGIKSIQLDFEELAAAPW